MATQVDVLTRRGGRSATRRWVTTHPTRQYRVYVVLVGFYLVAVLTGAAVVRWPEHVPPVTLAPLIVLAALFLTLRALRALYLIVSVFLTLSFVLLWGTSPFGLLAVAGLALLMVMMFVLASSRARLGISGFTGENMLVDLRDRLASGAELPVIPPGWAVDHAVLSANGEAFSGDALVAALSADGCHLEVVLIDVSGKGRDAGSRSLHLSGALSGLLGSVPADDFLPAANTYLLRQRWEEGFASAVHLEVDLVTGTYSIGCAGHPPAALFHAGTGGWTVARRANGPLLGILAEADFRRAQGQLQAGDAVLLYSDGIIESPEGNLIDGVDRMLGVASRALVAAGDGRGDVAQAICRAAPSGTSDDRSVFVLRRR